MWCCFGADAKIWADLPRQSDRAGAAKIQGQDQSGAGSKVRAVNPRGCTGRCHRWTNRPGEQSKGVPRVQFVAHQHGDGTPLAEPHSLLYKVVRL